MAVFSTRSKVWLRRCLDETRVLRTYEPRDANLAPIFGAASGLTDCRWQAPRGSLTQCPTSAEIYVGLNQTPCCHLDLTGASTSNYTCSLSGFLVDVLRKIHPGLVPELNPYNETRPTPPPRTSGRVGISLAECLTQPQLDSPLASVLP
jgi:hypothetical protein